MTGWRHALVIALAAAPLSVAAGTHTVGLDIGEASTSGLRCPRAETGLCKLEDDAFRAYYEFAPTETIGLRVTHADLSDLRLTTDTDEIFNQPSVLSIIRDLSVTVSFPLGGRVALRGRFGLAYWEEHRTLGTPFSRETSDGVSPVLGFGVDFGGRRVRAGLFADLYPAVGDTDYLACYGIGLRLVFGGRGHVRQDSRIAQPHAPTLTDAASR